MGRLQFVDACTEQHFKDMSLLHALGWRTAYRNSIPANYIAQEITDNRWVNVFRQNYKEDIYHGLLLYAGNYPLCCATYGPARVGNTVSDTICSFSSPDLAHWGELISSTATRTIGVWVTALFLWRRSSSA